MVTFLPELDAEPQRWPALEVAIGSGIRKMAEDWEHEATLAELNALEATVMPQNRSVVFVRGESCDDVDCPRNCSDVQNLQPRSDKPMTAKQALCTVNNAEPVEQCSAG